MYQNSKYICSPVKEWENHSDSRINVLKKKLKKKFQNSCTEKIKILSLQPQKNEVIFI